MSDQLLAYLAAIVVVTGLIAYALFGGADFGGGVWGLFATGPRKDEQRAAILHAMGPVWEANHVWLIFVIVVLFTCFPPAFASLARSLFIPFHIALLGIMLRGAAFVFRAYAEPARDTLTAKNSWFSRPATWERIFGVSSLIAPLMLGAGFGTVTAAPLEGAQSLPAWLGPYPLICGVLAVSTCSYLAAVYLCMETTGPLRDDFRRRAIIAGTSTAALAIATLYLAFFNARWFFDRMLSMQSLPVLIVGGVFFAGSAYAVFARRYRVARVCAAMEIILLLIGWAIAQSPYIAYPDYTLESAAGPATTTRFLLISLVPGLAVLIPSLFLLYSVFKSPVRK